MQKLSLSDFLLQCFTGRKIFQTLMLMKKIAIFSRTSLNILNNHIPRETIVKQCVMIKTHRGLMTKEGYLLKK